MAPRCGFELADMRAFDAAITPERIAATRAAAAACERPKRRCRRADEARRLGFARVEQPRPSRRGDAARRAFDISRVGTDGKLDAAIGMVHELDGTVDAIGLGGIDVYLYAGRHRYALRDGLRLLDAAKMTPVVDGSGLKNTLEREAVRFMQDELSIDLRGKHVLMVSALDRFGMAQALVDAGADVLFGDFIFALDKDMPVRGLARVRSAGREVSAGRVQAAVSVLLSDRQRNKRSRPSQSIPSITKRPRSSPAISTSCVSSCRSGSTARSC